MIQKKIVSLLCVFMATSVTLAGATFHPGDRGSQITAIQQALAGDGYDITVDGDYGTGTTAAIKQFQADHGLEADGILGAATYAELMGEAMPENYSDHFTERNTQAAEAVNKAVGNDTPLPVVTASNEIVVIQQALANNGYSIDVDGVFGVGTEQAIRNFQASHGLEPDGVVGQATFYSLTGQVLPTGPIRRFGNGGYGSYGGTRHADRYTDDYDYSGGGSRILGIANQYLGTPYVFGGTSPSGFDCSGFTRYVYSAAGIDLPRMADEQYNVGYSVAESDLEPGDLVFFTTYEPGVSHVGIYMGNHQFINASSEGVSIADLDSHYWRTRYVGAKRVM